MPKFVPGQRWISETEPELGLGLVLSLENNRVTVLFIASNERRTYAADNAPLTRVRFETGDKLESNDGLTLKVTGLTEKGGLLTYEGTGEGGAAVQLPETDLNHSLRFNKPQDRLFTGQLDPSSMFHLRLETLQWLGRLEQSPVRGLCGARISRIPHQLYIAHEVARREAPRVLLADEVGLGKTIEAGLVLHCQLLSGRADRVLLIVPEPLLHQWLVEMRRRFNLRFALFDHERCANSPGENPFESEQLVLCSLELFRSEPERHRQACEAGWDLCVVDEAHHLAWSEGEASPEYRLVEDIVQSAAGLLLLTATPEQLGKESHYARLRLLDPDRFFSFARFQAEEHEYVALAEVIRHLLDDPELDKANILKLKALLADDLADDLLEKLDQPTTSETARATLIQLLVDRHGTGRVLFRNTRATVKGFPERELISYPLAMPDAYSNLLAEPGPDLENRLHPETLMIASGGSAGDWMAVDPRIAWLIGTLKRINPAKALVICAKQSSAIDIEQAVRAAGVRAALFHEGLSIVARDRAAAWFADSEDGAQVLVCSEIGSEGRNFQFAHHLVLFDLPLNPDLLEQRIGRLDRIGQTETIRIHVPYFEHSAQSGLFRWYRDGLGAFARPTPAGLSVFTELESELRALLANPSPEQELALATRARGRSAEIEHALHAGRDRLLELNSCRNEEASELVELIRRADEDGLLWRYLERVFDEYGVAVEEHSEDIYILRPGEHMRTQFPEVPDEGITVTARRDIGLAREDVQFLTWEHPMVRGAMDLVINSEHGNAALSLARHPDFEPGQLLVETFFVVDCAAPKGLHIGRYFPPTLIRYLFDSSGADLSALPFEGFVEQPRQYDREHAQELIRGQRPLIGKIVGLARTNAEARLASIIAAGNQCMLDGMTAELKRLAALRRVNPNIRQAELDRMKDNALAMHGCIQAARQRLDAIRLIVTV